MSGEQHDPEYVKLNPNHVVPTLVVNDMALIESSLINEYLEDTFPEIKAFNCFNLPMVVFLIIDVDLMILFIFD